MIGNRFKELRLNKKLSQKKFGLDVGVSDSAISQIEKHKVSPSETLIIAVCLRWNVNREWLLTGKEPVFNEIAGEIVSESSKMMYNITKVCDEDMSIIHDVIEIFHSGHGSVKAALRSNIIEFKATIRAYDKIAALERKIDLLEKRLDPGSPPGELKEV